MKKIIYVALCLFTLSGFSISALPSVLAQENEARIKIDFAFLPVPDEFHGVIAKTIQSNMDSIPDTKRLTVSSLRVEGAWMYGVLIPTDVVEAQWEVDFDPADRVQILANRDASGSWNATVRGSKAFLQLAQEVPVEFMDFSFLFEAPESAQALKYLFPWTGGHTWLRTRESGQAWHGNNALDFAPSQHNNNPSTDYTVLAAVGGMVTMECTPEDDPIQTAIYIENAEGVMEYRHLDINSIPEDIVGQNVQQGQFIGRIYNGYSYSSKCGVGTGPHLHLGFPSQDWVIDGHHVKNIADAPPSRLYESSNTRIDDQQEYRYEYVIQSVPTSPLSVGQRFNLAFTVRNTGTETWQRDMVFLGTEHPKDRLSPFYQDGLSGWSSPNRVQMVEETVAPGEQGTFRAELVVPNRIGETLREHFRLVAEGIQWFSGSDLWFEVQVIDNTDPLLPPGQKGVDYKYEEIPNDYVCAPGGLVALQADANGTRPEIDFHIRKCDKGAFQQDGIIKLISGGQIIAEKSYQAGDKVVTFSKLDPYRSHNLIGWNDYVAEIYSDDDRDKAKLTGTVHAFVEPNRNDQPLTKPYTYQSNGPDDQCDDGLIKNAAVIVPNQPILNIEVSKCDNSAFIQDGRAVLMVNGMLIDQQDYKAGVTVIRFDNLDPNSTYDLFGRNSYQLQIFSADDPNSAKLSRIVEVWPKPLPRTQSVNPANYVVIEDNLCGLKGFVKLDANASGSSINFSLKKCDDTPFQQNGIAILTADKKVIAQRVYNSGAPSVDFNNLDPYGQYDLPSDVEFQVQIFSADDPAYAKLTGTTKIHAGVSTPTATEFILEPVQTIVRPGDIFQVKTMVSGAVNMYALQSTCLVDPDKLAWKQVRYNDLLSNALVGVNDVNAVQGRWSGAVSLKHPAPPVTGDGLFATLEFEALSTGDVAIACEPLGSDQNGDPIVISPQNVTISVQQDTGVLGGVILMQGRDNHANINVKADGSSNSAVQTNEAGQYAFTSLANGEYNIEADANGYLPSCTNAVVTGSQSVEIPQTTLTGGDLTGDREINIADATLLGNNFGLSTTSQPVMNIIADINADGQVNVQDLAILGGNFGKSGCQAW